MLYANNYYGHTKEIIVRMNYSTNEYMITFKGRTNLHIKLLK
jgi:hypothetical protein